MQFRPCFVPWQTPTSPLLRHQLDAEANRMTALTAKDPPDRDAFAAHWRRIRGCEVAESLFRLT